MKPSSSFPNPHFVSCHPTPPKPLSTSTSGVETASLNLRSIAREEDTVIYLRWL